MDRVIEKKVKPWWQHKLLLILLLILLCICAAMTAAYVLISTRDIDMSIDKSHLLFGIVQQGPLEIKVRGNGVLVPENVQWIASQVAGRVETVKVKAGAKVNKGDVLVQLSNPELHQFAEETRWSMEAMVAEQEALKLNLQSQLLSQQAIALKAQFAYESAALKLAAEQQLMAGNPGIVSDIDFQRTKLNASQLKQTAAIEQQRLVSFEANMVSQSLIF